MRLGLPNLQPAGGLKVNTTHDEIELIELQQIASESLAPATYRA